MGSVGAAVCSLPCSVGLDVVVHGRRAGLALYLHKRFGAMAFLAKVIQSVIRERRWINWLPAFVSL